MAWIRSGCGWLRVGDADDEHDAVGCVFGWLMMNMMRLVACR